MKNVFFYDTDIGKIAIVEDGIAITNVYFEDIPANQNAKLIETPLLREAGKQIQEYFSGKRKCFELPISPVGTEFQKRVWIALQKIPYGQTRSYKEIAREVGNDKACRAVGMANNKNPIAIIIPCHRVIGSDGKLIGYAGGLKIKDFLLNMERDYE